MANFKTMIRTLMFVFVVLFCRYTVAPVLAIVIGEPPDDAAYMANKTFGAGVAMAM